MRDTVLIALAIATSVALIGWIGVWKFNETSMDSLPLLVISWLLLIVGSAASILLFIAKAILS